MKSPGIYKIQSKIKPERVYIGSSVNVRNRWRQHIQDLRKNNHRSGRLQNHYNKYGEEDLEFTVLIGCAKEELIDHEQYFIDMYRPYFNMNPNARNRLGAKFTEETKRKMSLLKKGLHLSPETEFKKGVKHTEEMREKRSKALKGINTWSKGCKLSEETKAKISASNKGRKCFWTGKKMSEETKRKMSESQKRIGNKPPNATGRKYSDEHRQRQSLASMGRTLSPETRKKLSDSLKKRATNPEIKRQLLERLNKNKLAS